MRFYYKDDGIVKNIRSAKYNSKFDRRTGEFLRWGETYDDDPDYCEFGPELLDIEIAEGECSGNCPFCYKSNGSNLENKYMDLNRFKELFSSFPPTVNQIAFGITDIDLNPDFWKIMEYSRKNGVVPNYTTNGYLVDEIVAEKTAKICGAVAVSLYDEDICYDAVKKFSDAGMKQVNIHYMLAEETLDKAFQVIDDISNDPRLSDLYAIIFLQYKPHGRGINQFSPIKSLDKFKKLLTYAEAKKVGFGFDSCSSPIYLKTIENTTMYEERLQYVEPCESGLFSYYVNVDGEFFPCSFMEGEKDWEKGISSDGINNFMENIWYNKRIIEWRKKLINSSSSCDCKQSSVCRSCPGFPSVSSCKNSLIDLQIV